MTPTSPSPILDPRSQYKGIVIAVVGPPHSGKSVFLAELYRQLLDECPSQVFLTRACPDGEGMWSSEADPEIVRQIRRKSAFSDEFISATLQGIERMGRRSQHRLVLLDLGGKRTAENAEILKRSTHCMILSSDVDEIPQWEAFAAAEGCDVLAIFHSQLVDCLDGDSRIQRDMTARSVVQVDTNPMEGLWVNLDRDCGTDCYAEAIATLARALIIRYIDEFVEM